MEELETGSTSIHISKGDVKLFEKWGKQDLAVGNLYHTAVRGMDRYLEHREEKKKHLQNEIAKLKEKAEKWNFQLTANLQDLEGPDLKIDT